MSSASRRPYAAPLLMASLVLATAVSSQAQPSPSQGAPTPDWATVRALQQGTESVLSVAGRPPFACWILQADDSILVVFEPTDSDSAKRVRRMSSRLETIWPPIAAGRTVTYVEGVADWNPAIGRRLEVARGSVIALRLAGADVVHFLTPAPSFAELGTRLEIGDTVNVTGSAGQVVRGRITGMTGSSLSLRSGGSTREFQAGQIKELSTQRPPRSLVTGAVVGAVGATVLGILALSALNGGGDPEGTAPPGELLYLVPAAGAVVGALVARTPRKALLVYRAVSGSPSASLIVSPILTPTRHGVTIRWSF